MFCFVKDFFVFSVYIKVVFNGVNFYNDCVRYVLLIYLLFFLLIFLNFLFSILFIILFIIRIIFEFKNNFFLKN